MTLAVAASMGQQPCRAGHLSTLAGGGFDPAVGFIGEINYAGMNNKFMIMNVSDPNWVLTSLTIDLVNGVNFFQSSAAGIGTLTTSHNSYEFGGLNTWTPNFSPANSWTAINDNGAPLTPGAINFATQVTGQNSVTFSFTGFDAFTGPTSGATTAQYDAWGFNTLFSSDGMTALTEGSALNGSTITATFLNTSSGLTQQVLTTIDKGGRGASLPFAAAASAVPEPASLSLFGMGLLGVLGVAARRRRATPASAV